MQNSTEFNPNEILRALGLSLSLKTHTEYWKFAITGSRPFIPQKIPGAYRGPFELSGSSACEFEYSYQVSILIDLNCDNRLL